MLSWLRLGGGFGVSETSMSLTKPLLNRINCLMILFHFLLLDDIVSFSFTWITHRKHKFHHNWYNQLRSHLLFFEFNCFVFALAPC